MIPEGKKIACSIKNPRLAHYSVGSKNNQYILVSIPDHSHSSVQFFQDEHARAGRVWETVSFWIRAPRFWRASHIHANLSISLRGTKDGKNRDLASTGWDSNNNR
jgi:hypothetical protein